MTAGTIHVLHVDDDREFSELTAAFLTREADRFEVVTAASGAEAMRTLRGDGPVDCVVSDYEMPEWTGIELLERVRAEWPDLPFVLFTSKGNESVASRAISAGVTDYLQKGRGGEQHALLANRIENAVSRYESDRELRRWKQAIETASEGIAIVGPAGRHRQTNAAYAGVYDATPDDLVGTDWRDRYDDDEVARFEERALPELHREGSWSGEAVGRTVDGDPVEESVSLSLLDEGGHVRILRDVSTEKRRERDLERYERVVEAVREGVYVLDEDLRFVFVNPAMTALTGLDRGELLGAPLSRVVDTETTAAGREARESLLESDREVETVAAELRTTDDETVHCEFRFSVFPSDDGVHTVGTVRDVTDRRAYETELEAVRDRMDFALDATDSIIFEVDIETGEQTRHGPFERLYGFPSTAVPTTESFYERAIHPDDREGIEALRERFLTTTDERVEYEYRTHPDAGPVRWIRSEAYVHSGPSGDPKRLIGLATDVTRRKRRERELERRNERLDEVVGVASHDLRNPLNVAMGALDAARDDCDSDRLDTVARAHDRIQALVEDLLTLARDGSTPVEAEPLSLARLAEDCWGTVETGAASLVTESDGRVRADERRTRQLLENLLSNAVTHGSTNPGSRSSEEAVANGSTNPRPPRGEDDAAAVTVRVGMIDGGAGDDGSGDAGGFYVADDGPGIPPGERDRVFEEGYSTAEAGTGFGLYIVREVAEAHGWEVTVTDGPAGGARFEVTGVELVD